MDSSILEQFEGLKTEKPFVLSGECSDEIVLHFDDSNELYVSKNFLSYASPVFKVMFQEGFKECEEKTVNLRGKKYEDVLELLMCIHPAILKPVDRTNVITVFPLTEEYHITVLKEKCELTLKHWLDKTKQSIQSNSSVSSNTQYTRAEVGLNILALVASLNHDDLINYTIEVLSFCRFKAITGLHFTTPYEASGDDPIKCRERCVCVFGNLPEVIKVKVLSARLNKCDA